MNDMIQINTTTIRALHHLLGEMLNSIPDGSKQAEDEGLMKEPPRRVLPGSVVFRTWAVPVDILVTGGQVQRFAVRADLFDMSDAIDDDESLMGCSGTDFVVERARPVVEETIEEDTFMHAARLEKGTPDVINRRAPWTVKR